MSNGIDEAEANGLSDEQMLVLMADHLREIDDIADRLSLHERDGRLRETRARTASIAKAWGLHL